MRRAANVIGACQAVILAATVVVGAALATQGDAGAIGGTLSIAVMLGVTLGVGWVLASRMPQHPMGWLLLAISGFFLLAAVMFAVGYLLLDRLPGVAAWAFWYAGNSDQGWVWLPPIGLLFTQVPLRFPDGRLPTARWRWFSAFTIGSVVIGSALIATSPGEVYSGVDNPIGIASSDRAQAVLVAVVATSLLISFVGSAASVIIRYRRAALLERTQIRWFAWAVSMVIAFYVASFFVPGGILDNWVALAYTLIPASIGIAVLRYHLYDIDRLVSRTTSYALVTAMLLVIYGVVVTTISRFLPSSSSLAVAAATLAAAAAFRPLLSRVQSQVDHRFNRSQYDARLTVEEFAARLRQEVDTETVAADLLGVVQRTVQPSSVGVWIRK
jgi:hypothetical protein